MQYPRLYHLDHKLTPGERIWQLGQLMNFSNKCGNHTIEPNAKEVGGIGLTQKKRTSSNINSTRAEY